MTSRSDGSAPGYFGKGDELFGVHHPGNGAVARNSAVLLCPPFGQEYIRTHRLYRQLATQLATRGFSCLRFDYYGSGDSAGASEAFDLVRCQQDILAASKHLREISGQRRVFGFGARLGASLLMEGADALGVAGLMLWDPVLDGTALVTRMDALQQAMVRDPERFLAPRKHVDAIGEWSGFTVSDTLRGQLQQLRPAWPDRPTLLIESFSGVSPSGSPGQDSQQQSLSQPTPWEDLERQEIAILSHELVRFTADWLEVRG